MGILKINNGELRQGIGKLLNLDCDFRGAQILKSSTDCEWRKKNSLNKKKILVKGNSYFGVGGRGVFEYSGRTRLILTRITLLDG